MTFPKRPKSHVTGDRAVRLFKAACAPAWVVAEVTPDYGLDLRIELTEGDEVIGQEIHVQVKGSSRPVKEQPTVEIRQSTINYWLAKLAPILISLVDTESGKIWYAWLENAYPLYPEQRDTDSSVSLGLSQCTSKRPLSEEIPRYTARYYGLLGSTTNNLAQRARLLEILFHVVAITHLFYGIWFYAQGIPTNKHERVDEILEKLRLFYQDFGTHDVFLQNLWRHFSGSSVSRPVREAFRSRFSAYDEIKDSFFVIPSSSEDHPAVPIVGRHHEADGTIVMMRLRFKELLAAVGPALHVLRDIEGLIFRILLLGRIKFIDG
jgi:hypothetical protein